ncbi:threonine--tRNA ligase [candidate division KSB1 bacterium]|nr:MAG: threonine--tRNA ligase [candidate division KSB1 bacterium]
MENKKEIIIEFNNFEGKKFKAGVSPLDVANSVEKSAVKKSVAAKFNDKMIDLTEPLYEDGKLELVTYDTPEGMEVYWHSTSHLMANAIKNLFPEAKIAIGPPIEKGFYYDIDYKDSFTPEDLKKIEEEMDKIAKQDIKIERKILNKEEAIKHFRKLNEDYKVELLGEIEDNEVSLYFQGNFSDLCRGPHLPSTGYIKNFKLISLAGAYWKGDEKNKMLQRIYGISFPEKEKLENYLNFLKEAKKRDHRKLGKELDLFSFHNEAPGFVFWHPKGMIIVNEIYNFLRKVYREWGYKEILTPVLMNEQLWRQSGHWDKFKEEMYFTKIENINYALKPMNCPGSILIYKNRLRSYRDLPIRYPEFGHDHRNEKSGVLHGLFRVRAFIQDDAHIYCTPAQIKEEIFTLIDLTTKIYKIFGFDNYKVELSTRPEKYIGSIDMWNFAEKILSEVLEEQGIPHKINPGDGAFYGPKIDFHIFDCLMRGWQCGTIQLDFAMPERFNLEYTDKDGAKKKPVMIHRTFLGSIERFIGILIEHYAGDIPFWLTPVQVMIIPVSEKYHNYALKVYKLLINNNFRTEIDLRNEKVGYKIRESEMQKVPFMCIVGEKEITTNTVSLRKRKSGDIGKKSLNELIQFFEQEKGDVFSLIKKGE